MFRSFRALSGSRFTRGRADLSRSMSNFIAAMGDDAALQKIKDDSSKKVFYFTANWCPPCRKIGPVFEALSKVHTTVNFVKIDVDKCPEIAAEYNIRSVPTFAFISGQKKIAEFSGALEASLAQRIEELEQSK